jgi:hypothetical protein
MRIIRLPPLLSNLSNNRDIISSRSTNNPSQALTMS